MKPNYKLIQAYIESVVIEQTETTTPKEAYTEIFRRFNAEACYPDNLKRIPNNQARFADWLQGIPVNIAFNNYEILQLAKSWNSLPEHPTERQEDKILENYWLFMAVNFAKFARRAGVDV